jgi:hypothetical protein
MCQEKEQLVTYQRVIACHSLENPHHPKAEVSPVACESRTATLLNSMSAFAVAIGGKADMPFALSMSANDPKRTLMLQNHLSECYLSVCSFATIRCPILTVRDDDEAARVHHASQLRGGDLAACCPRAAA